MKFIIRINKFFVSQLYQNGLHLCKRRISQNVLVILFFKGVTIGVSHSFYENPKKEKMRDTYCKNIYYAYGFIVTSSICL